MKRFWLKMLFVSMLCVVAAMGLTGCEDDDEDEDAPANITGTWACAFYSEDGSTLQESWTIGQSGQDIFGSYTFDGTSWSYTGSYIEGVLSAVDADGWVLRLEFEGDSASGTISGDGEVWTANLSR